MALEEPERLPRGAAEGVAVEGHEDEGEAVENLEQALQRAEHALHDDALARIAALPLAVDPSPHARKRRHEESADRERAEAQRCPRGAAGDLGGPATVRDASCSRIYWSAGRELRSETPELSSSRV